VLFPPVPNYTYQVKSDTVVFNNTSLYGVSYLWDFGDGQTSTSASPTHVYAGPGTYTVKLTCINQCKLVAKSNIVNVTTDIHDLTGKVGVRILPNPTEGDFAVELNARTVVGSVNLRLLDTQGKLIRTVTADMTAPVLLVPFEGLKLPKGMYQLNIQAMHGMQTFKVVVQ
jgi:hypothetical protein